MKTAAYAATASDGPLGPFTIDRREPGPGDVAIDILYAGICHSDFHQVRNAFGRTRYPIVPGHEIVGRVVRVGPEVTRLREGDIVGVGGMSDSCRACRWCSAGHEQFCEKGATSTYNGTEMDRTTPTYGGYSKHIVVKDHFARKVPPTLDLAAAAPLLCAGVSTYSALRQWNVKKGTRVGVLGLGGLGHVGVKIAAAMGAHVTMLSTSRSKEADAQRLGAKEFALTSEPATFEKLASSFDVILDTVAANHDYNQFLSLLQPFGTMAVLGGPVTPVPVSAFSLIMGSKRLVGSAIGGIRELQETLDFCGEHGIACDVEVIAASKINAAFERMLANDVRYRFVIDASTF